MATTLPQYHENKLEPVHSDEVALQDVLNRLQSLIRKGVELLKSERPVPDPASDASYGSISSGDLGEFSNDIEA
jgi:hypothetical protein